MHPQKKQIRHLQQAEVGRWLSDSKAKVGLYKEALDIYNLPELDKLYNLSKLERFILNIVDWSEALEEVETLLFIRVLLESTSIASWVSPTWAEVNQKLLQIF
uniref:Uncharacterized protein n=1 Tax=Cyanothece sp. (strain PCC 7425 / ATCC 29141) TaxID=395961 RepID=B8HW64_CYAP4